MHHSKSVGCKKWRTSQIEERLPSVHVHGQQQKKQLGDPNGCLLLGLLAFHFAKTSFIDCSDKSALVEAG